MTARSKFSKIEAHGVVLVDDKHGKPPVDLLGWCAVPDVAVPREGVRDSGGQMIHRERTCEAWGRRSGSLRRRSPIPG